MRRPVLLLEMKWGMGFPSLGEWGGPKSHLGGGQTRRHGRGRPASSSSYPRLLHHPGCPSCRTSL
eukprot:11218253-Heterocapsa_arctica.AAC.1